MGIKFFCPNGHKMNVKDYLAGKRGICPKCSVRFTIPQESTEERVEEISADAPKQKAAAAPAAPAMPAAAPVAAAPTAPAAPVAAAPAPAAPAPPPVEPPAEPQAPMPNTPAEPQAPMPNTPAEPPAPMPNTPAEPQAPMPNTLAPPPIPAPAIPAPAIPAPPGPPAPPVNNQTDDVFAQNINGQWHIRLPSGDQYGPAPSDEMRNWLKEGRVTEDCLVWCEGWDDWKRSGDVFDELSEDAGPKKVKVKAKAKGAVKVKVKAKAAPAFGGDGDTDTREFLTNIKQDGDGKKDGEPTAYYTNRSRSNVSAGVTIVLIIILALIIPFAIFVIQQGAEPLEDGEAPSVLGRKAGMVRFRIDEAGIVVNMPTSSPQVQSKKEVTSAGAIESTNYVSDKSVDFGYVFSVNVGQIRDREAANSNRREFFSTSKANLMKSVSGGRETGSRAMSIGKHPGQEYTYQGSNTTRRTQIFIVDRYRVALSVQALHGNSIQDDLPKEFFGSFRLLRSEDKPKYGR